MSHFLLLSTPTHVVHIIKYESSRHVLFYSLLLYVGVFRILLFVFSLCHHQFVFVREWEAELHVQQNDRQKSNFYILSTINKWNSTQKIDVLNCILVG
jgi:hypothetical protein